MSFRSRQSSKLLRFAFFSSLLAGVLLPVAAHAQTSTCGTETWVTPTTQLNNGDGGPAGLWPILASSTHFDLHYDPALGTPDPTQMQNNLTLLEDIWSQYMGAVGWPEPYCGSSPKYRAQVFISEAWWCNGGGFDGNIMALYVNPLAILDIAGTGHEFNHTLQFISGGLQGSNYGGWFWETHSQWMRHQLRELHENMDCSYILVGEPHLYFGSTRDNFCSWDFFEYEKDKYGYTAITNIWFNSPKPTAANASTADPIWIYASNMGWTQSQLNDEFGRWAMANVNWDQYVDPNGNNQAPLMRSYYGANTANTGINDNFWPNWTRTRLTQLNAVNNSSSPRTYQVPSYWAPQRFGYNLVRLIPDPGATSVTVNFTGFVQSSAANTNFGSYGNVPSALPPPAADWRWGLVAVDVNGHERKSALQSGASASLTFNVTPSDQGLYMVVVGTPDNQQSIFDDQLYFTIYRYPWMVQLENAQPDGYQAGYQLPYVASGQITGTTWPNGGGFVANGVTVGPNVYIGPHAAVLGGTVTGNAVIQDNATVWNGSVSGNAVIGALTQFNDNITISGSAKILAVKDVQGLLSANGVFGGTAQLIGDVEEYISTAPSTGVFYGIINDSSDQQASYGAGVTTPPVEVTAPVVMGTSPQTITFTGIPNQTAGTSAPLSATALSGLPVAFYTTTPTVCSVSGFSVNSLAAGTCTVQASQAGNGTYAAASTTTSFTVSAPTSPVAQTITFQPMPSLAVVGTSFTLYASATSGLPVSFTSTTPSYCSLPANSSTLSLVATGTCTVQASQAGNGSFQAAPAAAVSFTITAQQQQTINFPAFPFEVVINSPFSPVASATSGLPLTYTSLSPNVCTVSGNSVNPTATGTCTVQAAQAGNAQYAAAASVQQSFTITALHPQTINFPAIPAQTAGNTVTLSAQANSGLTVAYSTSTPAVCTVNSSAGTVALIAGGTCVITATQPGTGFFAAAPAVSQNVTVNPATPQAQTITFNTSSAQAVGSVLTVTATATSGLPVTFSVIPNGNCSLSGNSVTFLNVGNCGVVANQAGNAYYQAAPAVGRIIVVNNPTSQTITFNPLSAQLIGSPLTLSASASSGLTVSFASSTPGVCTVSGTSVTLSTAGTCTIVASQPGNSTYSAAPSITQSFTVSASHLSQTITFNAIPAQTLGTPLTVNATASSGLPVTYSVVQNGNCSVSGNVVTFLNVGACGVIANQAGNSVYAAAPAVGQVITVNAPVTQKSQTITFNPVAAQKHGTTLTMTATASSGLPITYVVVQNGNCSVSGAAVTFINPGACGVIATQPGNSTYSAAAAVGQVISVN